MVALADLLDLDLLEAHVNDHFVSARRHPTLPLTIYNYTARAQYAWHWDDVTRQTRGLIVHDDGTVVARPFPKFFSLEQLRAAEITLPDEPFEVFEKLDGSLGIAYHHDGAWYIASRGSFVSEQAQRATAMLRRYERERGIELDPSKTYCVEILYPENRIVVDYGDLEDIVLLAVFDTDTGDEMPHHRAIECGLPFAAGFTFASVESLVEALEDDPTFQGQEGFVLRYRSGLRVKVKSSEYLHYHRLVSRCTPKRIWEHLSEGRTIDSLTHGLWSAPAVWIRERAERLEDQHRTIENTLIGAMDGARSELGDRFFERKAFALWVQHHVSEYAGLMFAAYDSKPEDEIDQLIWKRLKPRGDEVFRPESEEL